jgi:hypothetical protein
VVEILAVSSSLRRMLVVEDPSRDVPNAYLVSGCD